MVVTGCADRAYDFGDSGSFDPDPTSDPDPTGDPPPPPPGIPGPPQLLDARFADNQTLQLTFTEAIAPTQAVDPQQFRLSAAFGADDPEYYFFGTFYQEVGQFNGSQDDCEEYCYEYCDGDYCYEQCWDYCYAPPGPPVRVVAITQLPELPEVLLLTLDNGIGSRVCETLEQQPPFFVADLFIHYTASGSAPVTDGQGERLASISEQWALERDGEFLYVEGFFPYMSPMLPIPCPF